MVYYLRPRSWLIIKAVPAGFPGQPAEHGQRLPDVETASPPARSGPGRQATVQVTLIRQQLYSIIHLEPGKLPRAFAEIRRVPRPDGLALAAVHIGPEVRHLDEWFGVEVSIDFRFLALAQITEHMRARA